MLIDSSGGAGSRPWWLLRSALITFNPPASVESANQRRPRASLGEASMPTAAGLRSRDRIAMATPHLTSSRPTPRPRGVKALQGQQAATPGPSCAALPGRAGAGGPRGPRAPSGRRPCPGREDGGPPATARPWKGLFP